MDRELKLSLSLIGTNCKNSIRSIWNSAYIENEHTINMDWFYSNALGGVRLLVPENYVDEAKLFLEKDFSDELEQSSGE